MADDGLPAGAPSGFKYITPLRPALPTSTPAVAPAPAAPAGAPSGYRPPPPLAAAPAQGPPGYLGSTGATGGVPAPTPQADWSIDWSKGGEVKLPQSVQDWGNIAGNEATMGTIMSLRAQADAARQRLGPVTAASADVAGSIASPTTLLNAVPYVGPELAGGVHEGIKSAVTNWTPDESWTDYLKRVGEDTAGGAAAGLVGQGTGLAAQKALPELIKGGVMTGTGWVGHKLLGGAAVPDFAKELPGLMGLYKMMDKTADWAGEQGKSLVSSPAAQQAIKNLILGAGSAFRQGTGPYDQWIPGQ